MTTHESNEQDSYVPSGHEQFVIKSLELLDISDEYETTLRQLAGHPDRLGVTTLGEDEADWLWEAEEYLKNLDNCLLTLLENSKYWAMHNQIETKRQRINELSAIIASRRASEAIRENMEMFQLLFEGDSWRQTRERAMRLISENPQLTADGE